MLSQAYNLTAAFVVAPLIGYTAYQNLYNKAPVGQGIAVALLILAIVICIYHVAKLIQSNTEGLESSIFLVGDGEICPSAFYKKGDRCNMAMPDYTCQEFGKTGSLVCQYKNVYSHCFADSGSVITRYGKKIIADLQLNDKVLTTNGYEPVYFIYRHKTMGNVINIHTRQYNVELTEYHLIMVNGEYKKASDVRAGDILQTTDGDAEVTNITYNTSYVTYFLTKSGNVYVNNILCSVYNISQTIGSLEAAAISVLPKVNIDLLVDSYQKYIMPLYL